MSVYLGNQKVGESILENKAKLGKIVEGSLEEITPDELYQTYFINDYKFTYSNGLKKVTFHNEIYEIGMDAFSYCDNLEEVLNFWGHKIADSAFYYCPKLKKIELKNLNVDIGAYVFRGSALENSNVEDIINSKAYSLGRNTFMECNNLTKLNLTFNNFPDTVSTSVTENNTVYMISGIEIQQGMFMSCTNLEEVYLGPKVVKINDQVFSNCPKLKKMTVMAQFPPEVGSMGFIDNVYNHSIEAIYIPAGTIERYKNSYPYWSNFADLFVEIE